MSFEDFSGLEDTGFYVGGDQIAPEDELFHSVYIAGTTRKNHINIEEIAGKYQIRGVEYNLTELNMIIIQVKEILINTKRDKGKDVILCFSYKNGFPPWVGTTKMSDGSLRECPMTSADRAIHDFCNTCRNQIIVAGIYCDKDGNPILTEEKKPIFIFIRGKGMRYSNVSNYLRDLYKEDSLEPIFEPPTKQSLAFEKNVVNNKRFVTNLTIGSETSSYGNTVNVFELKRGMKLSKDNVLDILKVAKQTLDKFNDKFDWTANNSIRNSAPQVAEGMLPIDNNTVTSEKGSDETVEEKAVEEKAVEAGVQTDKTFSFDGISF